MRSPRWLLALAVATAAACCFARLGALPLLQPDEGRNAEVAREMKDAGAWVVPTYDGQAYLDKPAFYFRLVALSMEAFGESETAARLPGALFAAALLALIHAFTRRAYGERAAALAVLVVGTTPLFVALARIVIFDMVLAWFVTAAVLAGFVAEAHDGATRARWYALAAACAALATLVKGPVGFLVPILVLAAFNLLDRRPGAMRRMFAPVNLLVFLAIVLPWFVGVTIRRHDFPAYGIVEESLHRFTTAQFHRGAPVWYYVPVIAGVFFPWSLLLPESAVAAWRARARWSRADRLLVAWSAVVVVFFSASQSKLPGYVLTAVVALGVLTARVLDRAWEDPRSGSGRLVRRGAIALAVVAALGALLLAAASTTPGGLAGVLHVRRGDLVRLAPASVPLLFSLAPVAVVAALGALRRDPRVACAAFALPPLLLLTVGFGAARRYADAGSARPLALAMPAVGPETEIACLRCLPNGLPFYLKRTITVITADGSESTSNYVLYTLRRAAAWPAGLVRLDELGPWLAHQDHPVYLMAGGRGHAQLDSIAARAGAPVQPVVAGWWAALLEPAASR
jgi:4-amino-4-deoxy-L-arabinose transferase-like glycosyltransferase